MLARDAVGTVTSVAVFGTAAAVHTEGCVGAALLRSAVASVRAENVGVVTLAVRVCAGHQLVMTRAVSAARVDVTDVVYLALWASVRVRAVAVE